jgi:hypothetical protein
MGAQAPAPAGAGLSFDSDPKSVFPCGDASLEISQFQISEPQQ